MNAQDCGGRYVIDETWRTLDEGQWERFPDAAAATLSSDGTLRRHRLLE